MELSFWDMLLRLLLALVIGGAIGWERGTSRRPAGFRTHILVSLGSAIAMLTGEMVLARGGSGDVTRIASQVITGVGFLGAGTIMKVGVNVKGLTTAASLWATACLCLAAGAGLYTMAIAGLVIVLMTLTILAKLEDRFIFGLTNEVLVTLVAEAPSPLLERLKAELDLQGINIRKLAVVADDDGRFEIKFEMHPVTLHQEFDFTHATAKICTLPNVISMKVDNA